MKRHLAQALADAEALLQAWRADPATLEELEAIAEAFAECLQAGHKILVAGNGGSLADAVHFAEEWTGRFRENRRPYPVMALAEPAHLTCVGNDVGFEDVFARPVTAFGRPGDVHSAIWCISCPAPPQTGSRSFTCWRCTPLSKPWKPGLSHDHFVSLP